MEIPMRTSLSLSLLFLASLGLVGCGGDRAGGSCEADLTITMPDGTSTTLDFCVDSSLDATFEFDPDLPPEVRDPEVVLKSTVDEGFECKVRISEPGACGEGYYAMDGSSGFVELTTLDCSGVGNDYEGVFTSSGGYLRVDEFDAGEEAGNLTGESLVTKMSGYLSVQTAEGLSLTGDFSLEDSITGVDSEQAECVVSDGDEDDDGHISMAFGGDDPDDQDSSVPTDGTDADSDTDSDSDADGSEYGGTCTIDAEKSQGYGRVCLEATQIAGGAESFSALCEQSAGGDWSTDDCEDGWFARCDCSLFGLVDQGIYFFYTSGKEDSAVNLCQEVGGTYTEADSSSPDTGSSK